jgi:hypothetical protein
VPLVIRAATQGQSKERVEAQASNVAHRNYSNSRPNPNQGRELIDRISTKSKRAGDASIDERQHKRR